MTIKDRIDTLKAELASLEAELNKPTAAKPGPLPSPSL